MSKVVAAASMSLDGYIAKQDNTIGRLFDWYQAGSAEFPTASPGITFHLTAESAAYWRSSTSDLGALVCGRTLFDFTGGWGGRHTMDVPVVVVTHHTPTEWIDAHPDAPFTFVGGVPEAVEQAKAIAGDRTVAVAAGTIAGQCLQLGGHPPALPGAALAHSGAGPSSPRRSCVRTWLPRPDGLTRMRVQLST